MSLIRDVCPTKTLLSFWAADAGLAGCRTSFGCFTAHYATWRNQENKQVGVAAQHNSFSSCFPPLPLQSFIPAFRKFFLSEQQKGKFNFNFHIKRKML